MREPAPAVAIRLLHLEDSELDHALVLAQLQRGGLPVQALRVESREEFLDALTRTWDLVISDYHLPGFTGVEALRLLRERAPSAAPFILVSGQIGEDTAVEAKRNGAADYLQNAKL